jgi:hypothetical protein
LFIADFYKFKVIYKVYKMTYISIIQKDINYNHMKLYYFHMKLELFYLIVKRLFNTLLVKMHYWKTQSKYFRLSSEINSNNSKSVGEDNKCLIDFFALLDVFLHL